MGWMNKPIKELQTVSYDILSEAKLLSYYETLRSI